MYAYSGDPESSQYQTIFPAVSFYYDRRDGNLAYIQLEYVNIETNKIFKEADRFFTDNGREYLIKINK